MRNAQKEREFKISGVGDGLLRFSDTQMRKNASLKASQHTSEEPPSSSALRFSLPGAGRMGKGGGRGYFPSRVRWKNEREEEGGNQRKGRQRGRGRVALHCLSS